MEEQNKSVLGLCALLSNINTCQGWANCCDILANVPLFHRCLLRSLSTHLKYLPSTRNWASKPHGDLNIRTPAKRNGGFMRLSVFPRVALQSHPAKTTALRWCPPRRGRSVDWLKAPGRNLTIPMAPWKLGKWHAGQRKAAETPRSGKRAQRLGK